MTALSRKTFLWTDVHTRARLLWRTCSSLCACSYVTRSAREDDVASVHQQKRVNLSIVVVVHTASRMHVCIQHVVCVYVDVYDILYVFNGDVYTCTQFCIHRRRSHFATHVVCFFYVCTLNKHEQHKIYIKTRVMTNISHTLSLFLCISV